jgi:SAM-dependent methyltransferase
MAEATSRDACIDRHRAYTIDIATRLNPKQVARLEAMLAPVRPGEAVLDAGCNSGFVVDFLPRSCVVFGVDVAEHLVAIARTRLARADVAPVEELPYPDSAVDVIIYGEILEHVFDPVAVLVEGRRVARRLLIGSVPNETSKWGPTGKHKPAGHAYHVRAFTDRTLRSALARAGLRPIDVRRFADFYLFTAGVPCGS